jgi:hypothetical protein
VASAEFGRSRAGRFVVIALGILAFAVGCSSSPASAPGAGSSSSLDASSQPTSPSTAPADAAKEEAKAAYLGMWRNYAKAATTADWQSPLLGEFATGDALGAMTRGLRSDHDKGLIAKGEPKNNPSVSSVEPSSGPMKVMIADCGDSSNWLRYRADTGQLADNEPEGRRSITASVERQPDGKWKVTGFAVMGVGTC